MKPCVILMKSGLTTTIGFINEIGDNLVLKTNESEKGILSCAMQYLKLAKSIMISARIGAYRFTTTNIPLTENFDL